MVVYYCISLFTLVTITITILYFSHHVIPLIGVHHLIVFFRNEPEAFLVSIPETPAGFSSSVCSPMAAPAFSWSTSLLSCRYVVVSRN